MEKNKFYITTPIFYSNGRPHIGHVFTMVLSDMLARYYRLRGDETFFLTGMDDHGSTVVKAAEKEGLTPQVWADQNAEIFKKAAQEVDIAFSYFIRTSDQKKHWPVAQEMWDRLEKAGDIYKKKYKGLYCVGHEAFITEKDLDSQGLCPDHGTKPETVEEENYFFKLSRYQNALQSVIESGELLITPEERKNEILQFILEGLEDVSFSRPADKLKGWGIPVPGDESQLMYVWVDALSNYLSGVDYFTGNELSQFWPADAQLMGKDILRFHAAIWPAMLLSTQVPLPKQLFVHGFINSGGHKMSKTRGNVIDPFHYIGRYGKDALRYFLAAEFPTAQDGDFTHERFIERYNGDLAKGLGNVAARILTLADGVDFSTVLKRPSEIDEAPRFKEVWQKYGDAFARRDLRAAIGEVWELLHWIDGYIETKKPSILL